VAGHGVADLRRESLSVTGDADLRRESWSVSGAADRRRESLSVAGTAETGPGMRGPEGTFGMQVQPWKVLGGRRRDGQQFDQEAQAARSAARAGPASGTRRGRKAQRASLKERDPW